MRRIFEQEFKADPCNFCHLVMKQILPRFIYACLVFEAFASIPALKLKRKFKPQDEEEESGENLTKIRKLAEGSTTLSPTEEVSKDSLNSASSPGDRFTIYDEISLPLSSNLSETKPLTSNPNVIDLIESSDDEPSETVSFSKSPQAERALLSSKLSSDEFAIVLRRQFTDKSHYLNFLFSFFDSPGFKDLSADISFAFYAEFCKTSSEIPESSVLIDYSKLNVHVSRLLGIFASKKGYAFVLNKLIENKCFDVNAEYNFCGYSGNAIVLLTDQVECLKLAIDAGLALKRPVIDEQKIERSSLWFVSKIGTKECEQLVMHSMNNINKFESSQISIQLENASNCAEVTHSVASNIPVCSDIVQFTTKQANI